ACHCPSAPAPDPTPRCISGRRPNAARALRAQVEPVDLLRRGSRTAVAFALVQPLRLPGEQARAERGRIDAERLADVVEGEGPLVVDRPDPLLGLLGEEARVR